MLDKGLELKATNKTISHRALRERRGGGIFSPAVEMDGRRKTHALRAGVL
jgi:hypothetical protein